MGRLILASVLASGLFAQNQTQPIVSSAFGDQLTLSERNLGATLIFTLNNTTPSLVRRYIIEVWANFEHGPARRMCVISTGRAEISNGGPVQLPVPCQLEPNAAQGNVLSHTARIVEAELENGWTWRAPRTIPMNP